MRILILSILMSFGAAAGELIELTGLSDAPDPFSPAVAGQATITSRWHVMNVVPDVSNQSVDIRTVHPDAGPVMNRVDDGPPHSTRCHAGGEGRERHVHKSADGWRCARTTKPVVDDLGEITQAPQNHESR